MARSARAPAGAGPVRRAAGGLVWREAAGARRVAVIHRPKRNDWSLPKGKLEPGEGFAAAALREVAEETGLATSLQAFAGCVVVEKRRGAKVTLYWHMALEGAARFVANDEADRLEWLTVEEAVDRLDQPAERRLLSRAGLARTPRPAPRRRDHAIS